MLVKVWNDNTYPYTEKFKGKQIDIAPKNYVEMDHNEASDFLGNNPGTARVNANGLQAPETYKMLRIEGSGPTRVEQFKCMMDGKTFQSQEKLNEHIRINYTAQMVDTDAKDILMSKKPGRPKGVKSDSSADRDSGPA